MIGQSNAGKLVRYMKEALNLTEVEQHLSTAPLNDHKVDRLIAYLKNSNLKSKDTVIFDLTCNFAPGPQMTTVDKRPHITGQMRANVKKFHLVDSKGHILVVPSAADVDTLISRITRVTGSLTTKDILVVNLTPLPRYQGSCCVVPAHGLQGNETPGTLNTLLRDIGVYMGRFGPLHRPDHDDVVISPMD